MTKVAFACLLMVACGLPTPPVDPSLGYRWETCTVTLYDSVDEYLQPYLKATIADWEASGAIKFDVVKYPAPTCTPTNEDGCCKTLPGIHVCSRDYGLTAWAGLAIYNDAYPPEYYLENAVILINDYFNKPYDSHRRQYVICQELGHALGFNHQPIGEPSCMSVDWKHASPSAENLELLRQKEATCRQ